MATRSYTLYSPVLGIGDGEGTLTVTDTNDDFFEIPDATADGQSALIDGAPATINSVSAALGPQVVVALVDGVIVNISVVPIQIIVETGLIDTAYIIYPDLPLGAEVISVSLPLLFPTPVGLPVCLTIDTTVLTDRGWTRAGEILPGSQVVTRDNGLQEVRWIGSQVMDFRDQPLLQKYRPIIFEQGSLAKGVPERRLTVSPHHAILMRGHHVELLFGETEVFVAAKHLVNGSTIRIDEICESVTYCHVLFDRHEIILAEGADVESLYLGNVAMRSIGAEARAEIFAIFPELREVASESMARARMLLKEYEARVLVDRIWDTGNASVARVGVRPRSKVRRAN